MLIQSCLAHIPIYYLSMFKIPAMVALIVENLQMDFLWSGAGEGKRDHLVRWDLVYKPKKLGGLGYGKIIVLKGALKVCLGSRRNHSLVIVPCLPKHAPY